MTGKRDAYTVKEVSELLGVSPGTIHKAIQDKELPAIRWGRTIRIPRVAYEDWLRRMSGMTPPPDAAATATAQGFRIVAAKKAAAQQIAIPKMDPLTTTMKGTQLDSDAEAAVIAILDIVKGHQHETFTTLDVKDTLKRLGFNPSVRRNGRGGSSFMSSALLHVKGMGLIRSTGRYVRVDQGANGFPAAVWEIVGKKP